MNRYHLGCGYRKIHGWINVDVLPSVNPDIVSDAFKLEGIESCSADELYICHCLEHSTRATFFGALKRWHEVLKPGGIIRIAVPDIEAAMKWYQQTGRLEDIRGLLWGGQRNAYDYHAVGWDEKTLAKDLIKVGFLNPHRYDWRETSHFYIDDYSNAMLPSVSYFSRRPGDKLGGMSVSLNMEAMKP